MGGKGKEGREVGIERKRNSSEEWKGRKGNMEEHGKRGEIRRKRKVR